MTAGIYLIACLPTGRFYVGSAVDTAKRFEYHRWQLRRKQHPNRHLQRAWDKYGAQAFVFEHVVDCEKADLIDCEQWAIDVLRPHFNMVPAGSVLGLKWSAQARTRHKATWREKVAPKIDRPAHGQAVKRAWRAGRYDQGMRAKSNQYTHRGRTYTVKEAAQKFGVNANTLKYRLAKGISFAKAVSLAPTRGGRFAKWAYRGRRRTMDEVAALCGVKAATIRARMGRGGYSFAQATQIHLG